MLNFALVKIIMIICLSVVDHINWFAFAEWSLLSGNHILLVHGVWSFQYAVELFSSILHFVQNVCVYLRLVCVLSLSHLNMMLALLNLSLEIISPCIYIFWNKFKISSVNSLNVWWSSSKEHSVMGFSLLGGFWWVIQSLLLLYLSFLFLLNPILVGFMFYAYRNVLISSRPSNLLACNCSPSFTGYQCYHSACCMRTPMSLPCKYCEPL